MNFLAKIRLATFATLLALTASLAFASTALAAPPSCDGTSSDDNIVCAIDPTTPDDTVGLDAGDDTYLQNSDVDTEYVGGDSLDNGNQGSGNGGNDSITINGNVNSCVDGDNVDGDGGNDTIVINGHVGCEVNGDYVDGNGGNDRITIKGEVDHDVSGDYSDVDGGDDTIKINGTVGGDVYGDNALGDGGSDTIVINGSVGGDVYGDDGGVGGDDTVVIGENADIGGTIYGDDGYDILEFTSVLQSILDGLNPAGGTLTINGHTYQWVDFEQLIGYIAELNLRTVYSRNGFIAVDVGNGVRVFNENGLVAFISYVALNGLAEGEGLVFQSAAHGQGWHVVVTNTGTLPGHPGVNVFQVTIYNAANSFVDQFTFDY